MKEAKEWITKLELNPHPTGAGYFAAPYQSLEKIPKEGLPDRFPDKRYLCSTIYYLLEKGQLSNFHRVKSDEQFNHIDGGNLVIHILNEKYNIYSKKILGKNMNAEPYVTIPYGCWFGYEVEDSNNAKFVLTTCVLSPAFDPADFEQGDRNTLLQKFPQQQSLIEKFTDAPKAVLNM